MTETEQQPTSNGSRCVFPSVAFVFAEMLTLFYSADMAYLEKTSMYLGLIFVGIACVGWVITGTQGGVFGRGLHSSTSHLNVSTFVGCLGWFQ